MRIKLARISGFCYGVRRAVNLAFEAALHSDNLFTLGELIHNPQVLEILKQRGVRVAGSMDEIPDGASVIIRSHGVKPEIKAELEKRNFRVIDATCPKVARVQQLAGRAEKEGARVVLFGDAEHSEVKAIAAHAGGKASIIKDAEGLRAVLQTIPRSEKIYFMAQTTQNLVQWRALSAELQRLRPDAEIYETICEATDERQLEVRRLAKEVQALIVVGGFQSANTRRLVEIAAEEHVPAFQVETEADLPLEKLKGYSTVGVAAGASTPSWMIRRILHSLERSSGSRFSVRTMLLEFWRFIVRSNILVAFAAAQLLYAASRLQGIEPSLSFQIIVAAYIFGMHLLNHFTDRFVTEINYPARVDFYDRFRRLLLTLGITGTASSLVLSYFLGPLTFIFILAMSLLGLIYRMELFKLGKASARRLMDIPGSKDLFLGMAWTVTIAVLVVPASGTGFTPATGVSAFFVFSLAFTRSLVYSIRDVQGDRMVGRETIPVLIGESKTRRLGALILFIAALLLVAAFVLRWSSVLALLLLVNLAYAFVTLWLTRSESNYSDVFFETIVEGNLVLSQLIAWAAHLLKLAS